MNKSIYLTVHAFSEVVSHCGRTKKGQGWSHDVTVRNWACFVGKKVEKFGQASTKVHALPPQTLNRVKLISIINAYYCHIF